MQHLSNAICRQRDSRPAWASALCDLRASFSADKSMTPYFTDSVFLRSDCPHLAYNTGEWELMCGLSMCGQCSSDPTAQICILSGHILQKDGLIINKLTVQNMSKLRKHWPTILNLKIQKWLLFSPHFSTFSPPFDKQTYFLHYQYPPPFPACNSQVGKLG